MRQWERVLVERGALGVYHGERRRQKALRIVESTLSDPTLGESGPGDHGLAPRPVPVDVLDGGDEIAEEPLRLFDLAFSQTRFSLDAVSLPEVSLVQAPGALEHVESWVAVEREQKVIPRDAEGIVPPTVDRCL
jgi:hypothetical protein